MCLAVDRRDTGLIRRRCSHHFEEEESDGKKSATVDEDLNVRAMSSAFQEIYTAGKFATPGSRYSRTY